MSTHGPAAFAGAVAVALKRHRRALPGELQVAARDLLRACGPYCSPKLDLTTAANVRVARGDVQDAIRALVPVAVRGGPLPAPSTPPTRSPGALGCEASPEPLPKVRRVRGPLPAQADEASPEPPPKFRRVLSLCELLQAPPSLISKDQEISHLRSVIAGLQNELLEGGATDPSPASPSTDCTRRLSRCARYRRMRERCGERLALLQADAAAGWCRGSCSSPVPVRECDNCGMDLSTSECSDCGLCMACGDCVCFEGSEYEGWPAPGPHLQAPCDPPGPRGLPLSRLPTISEALGSCGLLFDMSDEDDADSEGVEADT